MNKSNPILLVGDNPFHGISHLSQQNVKDRGKAINDPKYASSLVSKSLENGANGFMFSVSETTLKILSNIPEREKNQQISLYPIVPYAYEYVRIATHAGGITGLAKRFAKQLFLSGNIYAAVKGLKGVITSNYLDILNAYLSYEIKRVKKAAKCRGKVESLLLHEILTDMAISLDLNDLIRSFMSYLKKNGINPGFETRNFPLLVKKLNELNIDCSNISVAIPINKIGFYMNPSKIETEKALQVFNGKVIAMSVLAAGYLNPKEAIDYIKGVQNVSGIVVGVSNEKQATETFKLLNS